MSSDGITPSLGNMPFDKGGHSEAGHVPVPRQVLHDVNNLLTSIHSGIDLALTGELPANLRAFLHEAQNSARKGAQLLNACRQRHSEAPAAPGGACQEPAQKSALEPECLEGNERILIADDQHGFRMLLRAVLAYRGYQVAEAVNGEEAACMVAAADPPFSLVILDVGMPIKGGLEVLPSMRERFPNLPALVLSGSVDFYTVHPEGGRSLTAFLAKPFDNIELLRTVRRLLDLAKPG